MNQEKISYSTDGQFPTPETQIRNLIYEDQTGQLYGVLETDGRFFIHSVMYGPEKPSTIKHYRDILATLEENLAARGFTRYYTMADSENGFRYNEMLGFKTDLEVWDDIYEVMVKEL